MIEKLATTETLHSNHWALYLAYGSNLHPYRLQQRIASSKLIARIEIPNHRICFHKRGQDGSGKCDLVNGEYNDRCFGALYQMARSDIGELDLIEAGYQRNNIQLELAGKQCSGFTYQALPELIDDRLQPFDWYHELISLGADHLQINANHRDSLQQCTPLSDPESKRAEQQRRLLQQLRSYNRNHSPVTLNSGRVISQ
ncbi:MAG: hypothetical protein V7752_10205 [Halopseudomonas sp.]